MQNEQAELEEAVETPLIITLKSQKKKPQHKLDWVFLKRFCHVLIHALTSIQQYEKASRVMKYLSKVAWVNVCYVIFLFVFCLVEIYVGNAVMTAKSKFTQVIVDACLSGLNPQISKRFLLVFSITVIWILIANCMKTMRMFTTEGLIVSWRKNLTYHLQNRYLSQNNYYKLVNLDKRVDNPDQRLTNDIDGFSKMMGSILEKAFQSPTNVITYTYTTYVALGWQGPLICYGYFALGSIVNKILISPLVSLWFAQEHAEGNFRFSHVSLRTNSESVAFFDGQNREKEINNEYLNDVIRNRWRIAYRNAILNFHTNLFGYTGAILSLFIIAFSTFVLKNYVRKNESPGDLIARITMDSFYIITLVWGFTQFIQLGTEISEMAGYTARIGDMLEVMKDVEQIKEANDSVDLVDIDDANYIEFKNVSIYVPPSSEDESRKFLVRQLHFKLSKGQHLLIHGPSGSGKSSLLRILGNLWPYKTGSITRPSKKNVLFIPQQPYIFVGMTTLRDQITYPHAQKDEEEMNANEVLLLDALDKAEIRYILNRVEGKLDKKCDWSEMLSPGEKQRLALARVFYHKPLFVILDECTSAVDIRLEELVYKNIRSMEDITILSVGHRPSLFQFHDYYLRLDGKGGWVFGKVSSHTSSD